MDFRFGPHAPQLALEAVLVRSVGQGGRVDVRSMGTPALTGHCLVDASSHAGMFTVPEVFVS